MKGGQDPFIGARLGRDVEIRSVIGSGAMGKVYRGFQHGTGRDVAVKILHDELLSRTQLVQRFYREAKIAGKLRHPNVVEVYFTGEIPDTSPAASYIVMEFLDGPNLAEVLLENGGKLPLERALSVVLQMCDATGEGHTLGIVHRDLKPENVILLRREGRTRDFVKVLDFGIARAALPDESLETAQGAVFGTARYISPEGAQGLTVSAASDVYSLSVILYQLLAGRPPFEAEATVGLLLKHVHDAPPSIATQPGCAMLPATLVRVIMENLAKEPEKRAQNGRAFGAALVRAARDANMSVPGADRFDDETEAAPPHPPQRSSGSTAFVAPTLDDAPVPSRPGRVVSEPPPKKPPAGSSLGKVLLTLGAFATGVLLTALLLRKATPDPKPVDTERAAYVERARAALTDGHYTEPPGENVNDLVATGLKKWPNDGELRHLRSQAEQELITMAMAARSSGDLVGARDLAKDAYALDSTDNSARFLRAQLDDELKGIATGATVNTGQPRLVFESPAVAKPGEPLEMSCRIVPGAGGAKAKVSAIRVTVFPNGQTTGGTPVAITNADAFNVKAKLTSPSKIGSYDVSFEANVDGTVVRAMRDLDVAN